MQTQFDQLNSKTLQVYKLTLIAPENEPSSVSTARQKSSSSDAETFLRPACCLNVKCQQKGRTKHLLSPSKMNSGQTCLISSPRHVMKPRLASWKLVCCYMTWHAKLPLFLRSSSSSLLSRILYPSRSRFLELCLNQVIVSSS